MREVQWVVEEEIRNSCDYEKSLDSVSIGEKMRVGQKLWDRIDRRVEIGVVSNVSLAIEMEMISKQ